MSAAECIARIVQHVRLHFGGETIRDDAIALMKAIAQIGAPSGWHTPTARHTVLTAPSATLLATYVAALLASAIGMCAPTASPLAVVIDIVTHSARTAHVLPNIACAVDVLTRLGGMDDASRVQIVDRSAPFAHALQCFLQSSDVALHGSAEAAYAASRTTARHAWQRLHAELDARVVHPMGRCSFAVRRCDAYGAAQPPAADDRLHFVVYESDHAPATLLVTAASTVLNGTPVTASIAGIAQLLVPLLEQTHARTHTN